MFITRLYQSQPLPTRPEQSPTKLPPRPPSPSGSKPLLDRLSDRSKNDSIRFHKKTHQDQTEILGKKVDATIVRLQAVFDKKELFDKLPQDQQQSIHRLADCLNWVSDNLGDASKWDKKHRDKLVWACSSIGRIEFSSPERPLSKRFRQVARSLKHVADGGYLDWVSV